MKYPEKALIDFKLTAFKTLDGQQIINVFHAIISYNIRQVWNKH